MAAVVAAAEEEEAEAEVVAWALPRLFRKSVSAWPDPHGQLSFQF